MLIGGEIADKHTAGNVFPLPFSLQEIALGARGVSGWVKLRRSF